jgi:hypothetical protein
MELLNDELLRRLSRRDTAGPEFIEFELASEFAAYPAHSRSVSNVSKEDGVHSPLPS